MTTLPISLEDYVKMSIRVVTPRGDVLANYGTFSAKEWANEIKRVTYD